MTADVPTAEAITQSFSAQSLTDTVFTAVTVDRYDALLDEYKERKRRARTRREVVALDHRWSEIQDQLAAALSTPRSPLSPADVAQLRTELRRSPRNRSIVRALNDSAKTLPKSATDVDVRTVADLQVLPQVPEMIFEVQQSVITGGTDTVTSLTSLCDNSIEGGGTKTFEDSFAFTVRLYVPCPKWTNPFRWCWKTFTLAGASYKLVLEYGYEIDCDGFAAWGSAYAEACGTLLGVTLCASCEGRVIAAAAIGQETSGDKCVYGAGAKAEITCKFEGMTIYHAEWSLGLLVEAKCPDWKLPIEIYRLVDSQYQLSSS